MRKVCGWMGVVMVGVTACVMVAGCGVPRGALELARVEAAASQTAGTPEEVQAALRQQAARWQALATLLHQREWGGIGWVEEGFVALVERTAAVSRRQVELVDQQQDEPAKNRAMLAEFGKLWQQVERYLGQ